jgi:micrococcal nuclease
MRLIKLPCTMTLVVLLMIVAGCSDSGQAINKTPTKQKVAKEDVEVLDGDTIRWKNSTVRLLGFDAPEGLWEDAEASPFIGDQGEWADRATRELQRLITDASVIELGLYKNDRYGRQLAHLYVDGTTVAVPMIQARLAYESVTRYGEQGFPDEYAAILAAAREAGKPEFEDPHEWRRKNSKEPRND